MAIVRADTLFSFFSRAIIGKGGGGSVFVCQNGGDSS